MVDETDNMTRMYPQAMLKQFDNLPAEPQWSEYDIKAQFNSEVDWYFPVCFTFNFRRRSKTLMC